MKTKDLEKMMQVVSDAYECDDTVMNYYRDPTGDYGDTLAKFIAVECKETAAESGMAGIQAAYRAMLTAQNQIDSVCAALEKLSYLGRKR